MIKFNHLLQADIFKKIILVLLFSVVQNTFANTNLQTGDIIFHISKSSQSLAIQKATYSPYSHMGLIVNKQNQTWVLEAIQPVKYTALQQWINRGENQHYVVKRYKTNLTGPQKKKLIENAEQYLNKPYDIYFSWDNQAIYCSEIVWKAYNDALNIQLAPLEKLKQFNLNDPVVQKLMRQRYGNNIPFDEKVISPKAIYESKLLREVIKK
jgi:hypothetical protein